jgi:hypothetical protein
MENGFAMHPECPAILHYHEAYATPRTYWGVAGGRSILAVLERLLAGERPASRSTCAPASSRLHPARARSACASPARPAGERD